MPENVPIPRARPYDMSVPARRLERLHDRFGGGAVGGGQAANLVVGGDISRLKAGLDALGSGNAARARSVRDSLPANSLDRAILAWAIAVSGDTNVPSTEIAQAARELQGWPGMATLRNNSERALHRENPGPQAVLRAFGDTQPQTIEGAIVLARAHVAVGNLDRARAVLSPFWRTERLEANEEAAIIREFGRIIPAADHRHRMERMLYIDRIRSAERVAALAGGEALTKAWAAVTRGERNASALLDAVPQSQRSPATISPRRAICAATARNTARRPRPSCRPERCPDAGRPETWWFERRVLSRELLDMGDAQNAYRVVAAHVGGNPGDAGRCRLPCRLVCAARAERRATPRTVISPASSRSRKARFPSRAAITGSVARRKPAAGQCPAVLRARGGAWHRLLWPARRGQTRPQHDSGRLPQRLAMPTGATSRTGRPCRRSAGSRRQATQPRRHALPRTRPTDLEPGRTGAALAVMAERRSHFLSLRVGKWAAARGLEVGALAHPVGAIPASANISMAGKALAYAIARQESEFNVGARSGAGALGILQLLPGTARDMARKIGVSFNQARLTTDAGYNAALGAAYLGEQLERFDGSYILTFVAYNAGPTRARQWVERYGHPSGQSIEAVVDWIERIPFTETRGYVQRVMENYQVYKMRLSGRMDIVGDLTSGRRR
jgi:soluble lytic murein transglycosylase